MEKLTVYFGSNEIGDTTGMTDEQIADAVADIAEMTRTAVRRDFSATYKIEFKAGYGVNGVTVECDDDTIIPEVEAVIGSVFEAWCSR